MLAAARTFCSALAASALALTPAFANHELVVLPGGAEICLNGARFVGKVFADEGTILADPVTGSVYDGFDVPVYVASDPVQHAFAAVGAWHTFEVRYPADTFLVGDFALLEILASGGSFAALHLPVEDCTFVDNGEVVGSSGWTVESGSAEILTDAQFNYDGAVGDSLSFGSFWLLSTKGGGVPSGVDIDGELGVEFDVAAVSTTFAPKYPCYYDVFVGFYSSEINGGPAYDDIWWTALNSSVDLGESVPGVSGAGFGDSPGFDLVSRVVTSGGATNGSLFNDGGFFAPLGELLVGGGGQTVELRFSVGDQVDAFVDSGILIDKLTCTSALLFAAGFEVGFLEWDAAVGAP